MKKILLSTLVLASALVSCTSKQADIDSTPATNENISATAWKLSECAEDKVYSMENDIYLSFVDSANLSGSTECNRFIGKYSINDSKLKIENIGTTKMFCGEEKSQAEQKYMNALSLELDATISSNGEELVLKNAENGVEIKYVKCDSIPLTQSNRVLLHIKPIKKSS